MAALESNFGEKLSRYVEEVRSISKGIDASWFVRLFDYNNELIVEVFLEALPEGSKLPLRITVPTKAEDFDRYSMEENIQSLHDRLKSFVNSVNSLSIFNKR